MPKMLAFARVCQEHFREIKCGVCRPFFVSGVNPILDAVLEVSGNAEAVPAAESVPSDQVAIPDVKDENPGRVRSISAYYQISRCE